MPRPEYSDQLWIFVASPRIFLCVWSLNASILFFLSCVCFHSKWQQFLFGSFYRSQFSHSSGKNRVEKSSDTFACLKATEHDDSCAWMLNFVVFFAVLLLRLAFGSASKYWNNGMQLTPSPPSLSEQQTTAAVMRLKRSKKKVFSYALHTYMEDAHENVTTIYPCSSLSHTLSFILLHP